ncbi:MAG: VWA domain-containing protein [Acidobacteria bacterium]|nr:VWA domain-containing protein [Thermoanaerobaculia bacterium]MDI9631785.1 VWA domain-containing protein [Acidobacteriota bacterium]MBP7813120.1 VWA domain-containing protein [Thermoanaerobaculia bacterium]NLN10429.1 VWA domain-containing protein [Acidobacteriota bacterium]HPA95783.1 VWA domain-containing protein [Thermoanaerobaculia bacterium]
MSHRRILVTLLLALAYVFGSIAAAAALEVAILEPVPGSGAFGEIRVVAEVRGSEPVRELELFFQGKRVAARSAPPWVFRLDVGQENIDRAFRVVAHAADGRTSEAELTLPRIRIDLEVEARLQQLYVTVTRGGQRILDLPRSQFIVLDEGQRQQLVTFERGDVPLTAVLMVDSSLSMRGDRLRTALRGAGLFARGMAPLDEAMLLLFSDRLLYRSPFSHDPAVLERGLANVEASGGTALNDHLYLALQLLERRQGRRVVVLFSDGVDVDSLLPIAEVVTTARRSQALVYWLRLREGGGDPRESGHISVWRDHAEHRAELDGLARLVSASGGRIIDLARLEEAEAAFADVLAELREQYVLGYYPSGARQSGRWRRVEVRTGGSGLELRTRSGYFDE